MICFQPNGMLHTKKIVCPCSNCLEGIFTKCFSEADTEIQIKSVNHNEDDSDYEDSDYCMRNMVEMLMSSMSYEQIILLAF